MDTANEALRPGKAHPAQQIIDGFAAYQREHPVEGHTPSYTLVGHPPGATVRGAKLAMGLVIVSVLVIALLVLTRAVDTPALLCAVALIWIAGLWVLTRRARSTPKAQWRRLIGVQLIGDQVIVMRQPQDDEAYELLAVHRTDGTLWASVRAFESFWLHGTVIHAITIGSTSGELVTVEVAKIDPSALRLGLQDASIEVRAFEP